MMSKNTLFNLKCVPGYKIIPRSVQFIAIALLVILIGCSVQSSSSISISSGPDGGFYQRVTHAISDSVKQIVDLEVEAFPSQGSMENLQRLRDRQVEFALVQLDVASQDLRAGEIREIASLSNEVIYVLVKDDSEFQTFTDLKGKRIAIGTEGSGTYHTANFLFQEARLEAQPDESATLSEAFEKLRNGKVDALVWVTASGRSEMMQKMLSQQSNLRFLPFSATFLSYIKTRYPDAYDKAIIPMGIYNFSPTLPTEDILTLSTKTVLVNHHDVSKTKIRLLTWSILATFHRYAEFNSDLQTEEAIKVFQGGLYHVDPVAAEVMQQKQDPRSAWIRYLQENQLLRALLFLLAATSTIGGTVSVFLRRLRRERARRAVKDSYHDICLLTELYPKDPKQAKAKLQEMARRVRRLFFDGTLTQDVYDDLVKKINFLEEECSLLLKTSHQKVVQEILNFLDEWQSFVERDREAALLELEEMHDQYQSMALEGQIDLLTYLEMREVFLRLRQGQDTHSSNTVSKEMSVALGSSLKS